MLTILIKVGGKIPFSHIWVWEKRYVFSKSQGKMFFRTAENPDTCLIGSSNASDFSAIFSVCFSNFEHTISYLSRSNRPTAYNLTKKWKYFNRSAFRSTSNRSAFVNFAIFFRKALLDNTSERLLLFCYLPKFDIHPNPVGIYLLKVNNKHYNKM